jgi:hypothetical protein
MRMEGTEITKPSLAILSRASRRVMRGFSAESSGLFASKPIANLLQGMI